jgi:hypothetical protein
MGWDSQGPELKSLIERHSLLEIDSCGVGRQRFDIHHQGLGCKIDDPMIPRHVDVTFDSRNEYDLLATVTIATFNLASGLKPRFGILKLHDDCFVQVG